MKNKDNNTPQIFNFDKHEVRTTIHENGQVWFVAKDICGALGYKNITDTLSKHVLADERSSVSLGRQGKANTISESGMYALVLKSRKKEAIKFRKWVTSKVLPQIRQTGGYSYEKPLQLDITQANNARKIIMKFLKDYENRYAPTGQSINTRSALMQVHRFIREYYNVASYKNLDAGELATLENSLNDNAKAVLAAVKDLFVIDLENQSAIYQSDNSIRIISENGIKKWSIGYVLNQLEKAEAIQDKKKLPLPNNQIPRHMEMILEAVQGTLMNCSNQIDLIKSEELNLDLDQRIKLLRSISPNFKVCTTNIEIVAKSMFVDNYKEAKNTTAKDALNSIGYSIL